MYRWYVIFCRHVWATPITIPRYSASTPSEIIVYNSLVHIRDLVSVSSQDPDLGPYCYFNSTSGNMTTGYFASSGFMVSNTACRSACSQAGCSLYRESPFGSGTYSLMSQCAASEAFHYAPPNSQKEVKCPFVDMNLSKFLFRGTHFTVQWYWLGWPTSADCMNAVLCGPTSVFFDPSQSTSLQWCQPTPRGFYSQQCSNQLLPCIPPDLMKDLSLGYWTSHGFGQPYGCGAKLVALAALSGIDISLITNPTAFTILSTVTIQPFSIPHAFPSWTILFGTFLTFFVGIKLTSPASAVLSFFHKSLTVDQFTTWIETPEFQLAIPYQPISIAISFDVNRIRIFVNLKQVFSSPSTTSSYSIGSLSTSSLIPSNWTSSLIHVGPFFQATDDVVPGNTGGPNPYSFWSNSVSPIDFSVSNIRIVPQVLTTTVLPVVVTTTTTPTLATATTLQTNTIGSSIESTILESTTTPTTTVVGIVSVGTSLTSTQILTTPVSSFSGSTSASDFTSESPSQVPPAQETLSSNLSAAQIVLISVACLFGSGGILFVSWRFVSRRMKRRRSESIEIPLTGWHFNDITMITDPNQSNSMWIFP